MSYDEPPEPTEEEMMEHDAHQATTEHPIEIKGLTSAHVDATVRGIVRSHYQLDERIERELDRAIEERVGALVERVTMERVVVAIDAAIAEGFDTFDKWNGRVTGHTSVKEIIHKALTEKTRDQHNRKDSTVVEEAVAKAVAELFAGELKGVMGELVTSFKKQADDVFKARIVEALKGAVGIR